ncbi:hypothetical protein [Fundidesulfovibrio terrae]|uniref:hypothetical protein n=1 Tax=Fundidesulfovibrio terrae TaxID=2922866 RepID=UPI001FB00B0A|nr:hypothetical protein [Fundidesulfovibrio terrae]
MSQILRLPATGCRHFIQGRCLYEEHLNPGYHGEYRCRVITKLQELYDSFLNQADAFGLDELKATDIWEKRFRELYREDTGCQGHEPGDMNVFPGCVHCLEDICVPLLPQCGGCCSNYTHKPR